MCLNLGCHLTQVFLAKLRCSVIHHVIEPGAHWAAPHEPSIVGLQKLAVATFCNGFERLPIFVEGRLSSADLLLRRLRTLGRSRIFQNSAGALLLDSVAQVEALATEQLPHQALIAEIDSALQADLIVMTVVVY